MISIRQNDSGSLGLLVLLAGVGGGSAEILWVMVYGAFVPISGAKVARTVTESLFPALAADVSAAWVGVAIHMVLSVALAYAFAYAIWRPWVRARGPRATLAISVLAPAAVWAINFFVVLPPLNAEFVTLMPYSVTFVSKMLFAVVMGGALAQASCRSEPLPTIGSAAVRSRYSRL